MIYHFNTFLLKIYSFCPEYERKCHLLEAELPKAGLCFLLHLTVGLIVPLSDYKGAVWLQPGFLCALLSK